MPELLKPFPTAFADTFTPIALGELGTDRMGELADEVIARLAEHGMVMVRGLHREQAPHITAMARSSEVVEHCYKDETKRFSDVPAMEAWVGKDGGRQVVGAYHLSEWSGRPLRGRDLGV